MSLLLNKNFKKKFNRWFLSLMVENRELIFYWISNILIQRIENLAVELKNLKKLCWHITWINFNHFHFKQVYEPGPSIPCTELDKNTRRKGKTFLVALVGPDLKIMRMKLNIWHYYIFSASLIFHGYFSPAFFTPDLSDPSTVLLFWFPLCFQF